MESQLINQTIADTFIERPQGFSVGSRHFYLFPSTLGKLYLIANLTESLGINKRNLMLSPFIEALRLVHLHKSTCAHILTYYTMKKPKELFDSELVNKRKEYFSKELSDDDMATLFLAVLTSDKTAEIVKHLNLDREQERKERVLKVKNSKNTFTFGGLSVYGTIVGRFAEKYNWTMEYILWGISYSNLQLLMKDEIEQIYLTDDEIKKVHISKDKDKIDADDPKNWERIKSLKWD